MPTIDDPRMTPVLPPPRIRDRRAAAVAAVLALLGGLTIALGLRTEDGIPPPAALAAAPPASTAPAPPASPSPSPSPSPSASVPPPGGSSSSVLPSAGPSPAGTGPTAATGPTGTKPAGAGPAGMKASVPVRLEIPAIDVDTAIMPLGLRDDGTLEVPPVRGDAPAGWYRHSPTPGEVGASVLAGHVDSARDGPAVFYRLRELKVGDAVAVRRTDRSVARFRVTRVAVYPKHDFPSGDVYTHLDRPGLRLITCGGTFDRGEGSYRSNVVVFADPVT